MNTTKSSFLYKGFFFVKAENFKIEYHDKDKRKSNLGKYINGGFFAYYTENGINFTLPVGNLCCDINEKEFSEIQLKYIKNYIKNGKLYLSCNNNASYQFKGKSVSTLIIAQNNIASVVDTNILPTGIKYAISGVPTIRNGEDVDFYNYVKKQGWDNSCMYATYRNFIGIRNNEIWIITGRTKTNNYIYGMEMYNKLKDLKFQDVICLDGGGSYYFKDNSLISNPIGNRNINNVVGF